MTPGASGIILKDKKILLVRRGSSAPKFADTWVCPGGMAAENETPEQAAIREVKEELNLDFIPTALFKTWNYNNRDFYRFLGDWTGTAKLQKEELADYHWFSYDEAIKLDLGFDYREVIEQLHKEGFI